MKILQVNKADILGGAERIAWLLHRGYRERGEEAWLAVDEKRSEEPGVLQIPKRPWGRAVGGLWREGGGRARQRLRAYATNPGAFRRAILGQDSFAYPGTRGLGQLAPSPPDIVHAHNLHGSYFDLRAVVPLGRRAPLVVTMHDAWLFTGGCTHPLDCTRYMAGCGRCPHRAVHFRAALVDSTAFNFRRKARVLQQARMHLVAPCRWLMEKTDGTLLEPAVVSRRVIPNGVDTAVFRPGDRAAARAELGLPGDAWVVFHASARPTQNASKDFGTMREAVARVAASAQQPVIWLVAGETGPVQRAGGAEIRFVPFIADPVKLASLYAAADVYLQGSLADTFPNTVLEAMACGRAVVATSVGGIPEQAVAGGPGATGMLVPPQDAAAMGEALARVLGAAALRGAMEAAAVCRVRAAFTLERQIEAHLAMYRELLGEDR